MTNVHRMQSARAGPRHPWARRGLLLAVLLGGAWLASCDDGVQPSPPKQENLPPETFLVVQGDSLRPQFYKILLSWLGSDADGEVASYRRRWLCEPEAGTCLLDTTWSQTTAVSELFVLPVPNGTARYVFEVAAVDVEGVVDPTPVRQSFEFFNTPPVVDFELGTLPEQSLPAITFYLTAVDPDTTAEEDDADSRIHLDHYVVWLDGSENNPKIVPLQDDAVTLRQGDFEDRYGSRTIFVQVVDDGAAASEAVQHTWEVGSAPENGILLVDDCRMGGFLAARSDQSYRAALEAAAPDRRRVLDIEALPRMTRDDLEATLALFDRVIWYTDADTSSSGALELARGALLELLEERQGRFFLGSGLALGTNSVFGELESRFRDLFGVDTVYVGPGGTTNFAFSLTDTIRAAVHPGLTEFRMLSLGLDVIMECFGSRNDASTRSLYFYPESTLVRGDFVNPVQFDVGVYHETGGGARTVYVSLPIGLPINSNMGENETEILELFRLAGIVDP
ncbi:MAG: hypothetical protein ACE5G2_04375 [Candidatus Krumholzibacteriia bacterium]